METVTWLSGGQEKNPDQLVPFWDRTKLTILSLVAPAGYKLSPCSNPHNTDIDLKRESRYSVKFLHTKGKKERKKERY